LPAGAEVIDLSEVDASLEVCNDTLNHSFTLEPDAIVLYAGNNESKTLLEKLEIGDVHARPEDFSARWALYTTSSDSDIAARLKRALQTHSGK
jgi:hypothetical protein